MTVYIDLVMGLNFLVDLLLLLGTNQLSGFSGGWKRCILGAAVGAAYSGMCMVPGFRFLGNPLWRTVFLVLMAIVSFGCNASAVKRGGVFLILSMALGGMALSLGRGDSLGLILGAVGIWVLCQVAFGDGIGGREYVPLKLKFGGNCITTIALRDSGNTLRDPISGEQVFLIGQSLAQQLTGLTRQQLNAPFETLAKRSLPGLRLIPYRAVGQGAGMLLGMRMQEVWLGEKQVSAVIAFAPEGLEGGIHQALVTV